MTQNTADPAPAIQNNGKAQIPTTPYCWARVNSRPEINTETYTLYTYATLIYFIMYITVHNAIEKVIFG